MGCDMDGNRQIYSPKARKDKINKEKKRLNEIFKTMETARLKLVESLLNDAAFMRITIEETREIINRDGVIEEYQNGANQKGIKKSAAVEVYDKMVNTYSKIVKQLCDLLPEKVVWEEYEGEEEDPKEELMAYIEGLKR